MKNIILILMFSFVFVGCATHPEEIPAQHVSKLEYRDLNCEQIIGEMSIVGRKLGESHARLKKKAKDDDAQMGIGMILFWPTLFALDGDGVDTQQHGRLKGEYETLEKVAVHKSCNTKDVENPYDRIRQQELEEKKKEEAQEADEV